MSDTFLCISNQTTAYGTHTNHNYLNKGHKLNQREKHEGIVIGKNLIVKVEKRGEGKLESEIKKEEKAEYIGRYAQT